MCHNARSPVINIIYVRCTAETCILYDVVRWADRIVSVRSTNLAMENDKDDKDGVSEQKDKYRYNDFVNTCYI